MTDTIKPRTDWRHIFRAGHGRWWVSAFLMPRCIALGIEIFRLSEGRGAAFYIGPVCVFTGAITKEPTT